jgi:hypothetical protein
VQKAPNLERQQQHAKTAAAAAAAAAICRLVQVNAVQTELHC